MKNKWMDEADHALLHTYNRYPIVLEKGEGVYLYDTEERNTLILQPELPCAAWDMDIKAIQKH